MVLSVSRMPAARVVTKGSAGSSLAAVF